MNGPEEKIYKFLCADDKPYAQHEIANALGENPASVGVALRTLKNFGLINCSDVTTTEDSYPVYINISAKQR